MDHARGHAMAFEQDTETLARAVTRYLRCMRDQFLDVRLVEGVADEFECSSHPSDDARMVENVDERSLAIADRKAQTFDGHVIDARIHRAHVKTNVRSRTMRARHERVDGTAEELLGETVMRERPQPADVVGLIVKKNVGQDDRGVHGWFRERLHGPKEPNPPPDANEKAFAYEVSGDVSMMTWFERGQIRLRHVNPARAFPTRNEPELAFRQCRLSNDNAGSCHLRIEIYNGLTVRVHDLAKGTSEH